MSCGKYFQQQLLNRLDALEDSVLVLSAAPSALQLGAGVVNAGSGPVTLGSLTGGAAAKGFQILVPAGNTTTFGSADDRITYDNLLGSESKVVTCFPSGGTLPASWYFSEISVPDSEILVFF